MNQKFVILCSLFMFLCVLSTQIRAEDVEWARKAREQGGSPATKAAYEQAVAEQTTKRELQQQKKLKEESDRKAFIEKKALERAVAKEKARQDRLQEEELWNKEQAELDAQRQALAEKLQKQCGKDYGQIKVGMNLDRVQKCVAEFFLSGQISTKNGIVDHYTRGDSWLYVKKGKIVAWGD